MAKHHANPASADHTQKTERPTTARGAGAKRGEAEHIIPLTIARPSAEADLADCLDCQVSCQSACKTSCTVGNQRCPK